MDAVSEFLDAWSRWQPPPPPEIFWRLYHDDCGNPLRYSMQDEPGTWIAISCAEYHRASFSVWVRDGKILPRSVPLTKKLVPSATGTLCHPQDITVISTNGQGQHWSLRDDQD
jgi:hypothetical protein